MLYEAWPVPKACLNICQKELAASMGMGLGLECSRSLRRVIKRLAGFLFFDSCSLGWEARKLFPFHLAQRVF